MNKAMQADFATQSMCEMTAEEINVVAGGLAPVVFIAVAAGAAVVFDFMLDQYMANR